MLPTKLQRAAAVLVIAVLCLTAGCSTFKPDLVPSDAVRVLPIEDERAFDTFFSRWNAYTLALADGAEDMQDVYAELSDLGNTWSVGAYAEGSDGPSVVALYLPNDSGTMFLRAGSGAITSGTVSWNSDEETDVSAALSTMVACNALVYGLSAGADAGSAQNVYSACTRNMSRDAEGTLSSVPQFFGGYSYRLIMDPEKEINTFVGIRG